LRFTVHWPGNPVASPRSHGVSRRDVLRRVNVGVAGVSADGASENGLALARLSVHLSARRATLACERGCNPFHPAWSFLLESFISVGLAPCRSVGWVASIKERRHGLGEVSQRLLLHRLRALREPGVRCPRLSELSALLWKAGSTSPARTPVRMLLDREVPHVPGMSAVTPQHRLLGGRREQAVSRHANTLTNDTDISGEVKRPCLVGPTIEVSTPRSI